MRRLIPSRFLRYVRPMTNARDVLASFRALPVTGIEALTGTGPLLVLAPHPDDESLGCGGVIAEACARGETVYVTIVTDGAASHPNSQTHSRKRLQSTREQEVLAAVAELGLPPSRVSFLRLPDGRAPHRGPQFKDAVATLTRFARDNAIATICTTWQHDPHPDHLASFRLARATARSLGIRLFSYPVWGWTLSSRTWLPRAETDGFRVDVGAHLPAKRRAVACHKSQIAGLIEDDPAGFALSHEFRAIFDGPFETFIRS
ncbi:MAG: PIG-L family deacetylase [Acetobacteraceae bacterium]|nr:PIG-L family deacetylase [Acetobacteraceae bacterium]